jgi:ribosomal protein S18
MCSVCKFGYLPYLPSPISSPYSVPFIARTRPPNVQVYNPYDLSKLRMQQQPPARFRSQSPRLGPCAQVARENDEINALDIDIGSEYRNPIYLNGRLTDLGKIMGRNETGLSRKSQRKFGKTVRRARAMGIMPTLHKAQVATYEGDDPASIHYHRNF